MLRWLIPALGTAVLVWAVVLAFQGQFAVAFAIWDICRLLLSARQASPAAKQTLNTGRIGSGKAFCKTQKRDEARKPHPLIVQSHCAYLCAF